MRIRDVLDHKGREVLSIAPDETVLDAVSLLVEHNVGDVVNAARRSVKEENRQLRRYIKDDAR